MKVVFKDGSEKNFQEVNVWCNDEGVIGLIKRNYDDDGNYDEDEDEEIALLNTKEIRYIEMK